MSARLILVLALVAYVSIEANSYPYGVKGGQSHTYTQETFKGYQQPAQWHQVQQPFYEPAQVQAAPLAQQSFGQEVLTAKQPQQVLSAPVQVEAAPVKGQSFYQQEQRFEAGYKTPYVQQQPQRQEVVVAQQPQPLVSAPVQAEVPAFKGQSYQAPQYVQQPFRQEVVASQQPQPLVSAPAQVEAAPVKGQSFYQQEQRFEAGYKTPYVQQQPQRQEVVVAQQPQPLVSAPVQAEVPAFKGQSYQAPQYVQQPFRQEVVRAPAQVEAVPLKGQAAPHFQTSQTTYVQEPLAKSQPRLKN